MKKVLLVCLLLVMAAGGNRLFAQDKKKCDFGIFNHLAVGVSVGTPGIGVDVASPIGNYLALRAGVSFMPNFTFNSDVDVDLDIQEYGEESTELEVEGSLGRTSGELLLNVYPFRRSSFFVCGGAYFGGGKLVKIKGHSDELRDLVSQGNTAGIEIGDYTIPVDANGDVAGGLKVSSFRPYLGLGFGRAVPKKRVGFMFELGVQFHKTPEVYSDSGKLQQLGEMADNDFSDIIDQLTVYPVLKFRLCGRIF